MSRKSAVLREESQIPRWFALCASCAVTLTAIAALGLAAARLH
jgi:Na+-translocating ferredoxin:NAD+ oxidoreductase RnfE subunit